MQPITRRAVLGGLLATPLLAACAGFDTSGAAAPGTVGFLSAPRAGAVGTCCSACALRTSPWTPRTAT